MLDTENCWTFWYTYPRMDRTGQGEACCIVPDPSGAWDFSELSSWH
jgi:hypothetical protein